jgi:hypothetical protein
MQQLVLDPVPGILLTNAPGEMVADHWEEVIEAECPVCWEICSPVAPVGFCWRCHARYKATDAGCGLAAVLVVAGNPATALTHLTACSDCRDVFLDLGRTAEVAQQESTHLPLSLAAQGR